MGPRGNSPEEKQHRDGHDTAVPGAVPGAEGSPHLRQVPLLAGRDAAGLPSELALAQLGRARARPQAKLLADVVAQLPLARVLKVLREEPSGAVTAAPRELSPGGQRGKWWGWFEGRTWLPPSPWQGYMMRGFPPWLFSPTSRQLLVPSFLICGVGGREVLGGEKRRWWEKERGEK